MTTNGSLHLIPNLLSSDEVNTIPFSAVRAVEHIHVFYVEEIRSVRRFLRKLYPHFDIDACTFYVLNEHAKDDLVHAIPLLKKGVNIAYLSEAGTPCIADPGNLLVEMCHNNNIRVIPHVGPNSIMLALMASGLNGQQFTFHGYLPNKQPALNQKIKQLEKESSLTGYTQLFIETPYRNRQLLEALCSQCNSNTRLTLACNLTSKEEWIHTKTIREWKNAQPDIHKKPIVFLLLAG